MKEIKLYKTTAKGLKIIGLTIPFVVIGIWMITQDSPGTINYIMGWFGVCFFGLGIPVGLFQIFDKRPQIIINENGIWDRTTNQDEIKWEQIIVAYPIDIFGQKFVSIVADNTFIFKKKQYKWAAKINKQIGAQQLNLNLGQININVNTLNDLINKLSKSEKEERRNIIQSFKVNKVGSSLLGFQKAILYILSSIGLLMLTLTGLAAFWTIMIAMGVAALIARWYWGSNKDSKVRTYAETIAWFGFINMVLYLFTIKTYDHITESVGQKISTEAENYKNRYSKYPSGLETINIDGDLNLLEKYFANKIEYSLTDTDYELKLFDLFNKERIYDPKLQEWR
ncbi:STM3941 family protein [Aequorivita lipolytica]|uniref:Uncharacterized protein n=1 Tax=Aequorivita lipolytica TaxID=153267 RepID=A0A5C6YQG8_9FLAO|nr:STM3941 family protein [Aequorivita lipolytica]TXD69104.1 hypothetical protein ESV24_08650 [Aequorivita lipolytica]SRX51323.1 hypothetical protein AEQU2_01803 [Aequorivita lipolytica]